MSRPPSKYRTIWKRYFHSSFLAQSFAHAHPQNKKTTNLTEQRLCRLPSVFTNTSYIWKGTLNVRWIVARAITYKRNYFSRIWYLMSYERLIVWMCAWSYQPVLLMLSVSAFIRTKEWEGVKRLDNDNRKRIYTVEW